MPDLINKIKKTKKNINLYNLDHYRDFISMKNITKIIFILYKKRYLGVINIASGYPTHLKKIAKLICKKYHKNFNFVDNRKISYLVADISKLRKLFKYNLSNNIKSIIS